MQSVLQTLHNLLVTPRRLVTLRSQWWCCMAYWVNSTLVLESQGFGATARIGQAPVVLKLESAGVLESPVLQSKHRARVTSSRPGLQSLTTAPTVFLRVSKCILSHCLHDLDPATRCPMPLFRKPPAPPPLPHNLFRTCPQPEFAVRAWLQILAQDLVARVCLSRDCGYCKQP